MLPINTIIITALAIVAIVTIKGFTKAFVSASLGDPLPKRDRRLTLNPKSHVEIIGLILMYITNGFGWERPVETSALYYKNRRRDILITNITPSVVLIIFAVLASVSMTFLTTLNLLVINFLNTFSLLAVRLAIFNLVPIYPMDGAKILSLYLRPNQVVGMASREKMLLMIFLLLMLVWPQNPVNTVIWQISFNILNFGRALFI